MKVAVLHHNDADGFGAAYACWKALKAEHELKFIPVQYSQEPPLEDLREFGAEEVYIVDFSYKRGVLVEFLNEFPNTVVIDHHGPTQEDISQAYAASGGNSHYVFNQQLSGAVLTWDYMFNIGDDDLLPPPILNYVQDRDLWRFTLPNSKEVNAYIATLPWDFEVWDAFKIEDALLVGSALVKQQKRQIDARLKDVRMVQLHQGPNQEMFFMTNPAVVGAKEPWKSLVCIVPIVNATENISELGEAMCLAYPDSPFSVSYADRADGKRSYSLRSRNGFDVSEVAKAFGGGGHKAAAGFTLAAPEVI